MTNENISKHCQISPGGPNLPWRRTTERSDCLLVRSFIFSSIHVCFDWYICFYLATLYVEVSVHQVSSQALEMPRKHSRHAHETYSRVGNTDADQIITQTLPTELHAPRKRTVALGTQIIQDPDVGSGLREVRLEVRAPAKAPWQTGAQRAQGCWEGSWWLREAESGFALHLWI